jgi:uridine kinase
MIQHNIKTIIITGEKGGTGKSTVSSLLIEYIDHKQKGFILIDLDPLKIISKYYSNCQEEGRKFINENSYQIIDTAGIIGANLNYLKKADIVIVPFRPHYPDLSVIIP